MHSTRVRIHAPRYGGATTSMESLQPNHTKETLRQPHTLERRASPSKTKGRGSDPKIKPQPISGNRFRSHHPSQTFEKDAWNIFELMELQDALTNS